MMYPVRTTLLLTVDEKTAQKFLREEQAVEGAHENQPRHNRRFPWLKVAGYGVAQLLLFLGQRLHRIA